jgi:hypothetical protein
VEVLTSGEVNAHKPNMVAETGNGSIVPDTDKTEREQVGDPPRLGKRNAFRVQIEEIEDEYWEAEARMPKARSGIIEDADEEVFPSEREEVAERVEEITEETDGNEPLPPPPTPMEPITILPKRNHKPGSSAIGVSVLSV